MANRLGEEGSQTGRLRLNVLPLLRRPGVPLCEGLVAVGVTAVGGLRRDEQALTFAKESVKAVPSPKLTF